MFNKLKYAAAVAAMAFAPMSMALTSSDIDASYNVSIGGNPVFFNGSVTASETEDFILFKLNGSQGTTTAASAIFNFTSSGPAPQMDLFSFTAADESNLGLGGALGSHIAAATLAALPPSLGGGTGYVLSAFLTGGQVYALRIGATPGANSYAGQISAVPLPGAALLFGSALMGAGVMGRKKLAGNKAEAVAA